MLSVKKVKNRSATFSPWSAMAAGRVKPGAVAKVPEGEGRARALGMGIALLVGKRLLVLAVVLRRRGVRRLAHSNDAGRSCGVACPCKHKAGEVACRVVCQLAQTGLFEQPGMYADPLERFFNIARDRS